MLKTSSAAEILNSIRKVYRGEEAIETEVDNKIKYLDIPMTIERLLSDIRIYCQPRYCRSIEQTDAETRRLTREILKT